MGQPPLPVVNARVFGALEPQDRCLFAVLDQENAPYDGARGYAVAINALKCIDPATLSAWLGAGDTVLIDVREPAEHDREHIAGSRLMPLSQLDSHSLPRDKRIVLYCAGGCRSRSAARRLGIDGLAQLDGGIAAWTAAGFPTIQPARPEPTRYFEPPAQFA